MWQREVKSILTEHRLVYEATVIAVPDEMRDEAIKAYVILQEGATISEEDLIAYVENASQNLRHVHLSEKFKNTFYVTLVLVKANDIKN